VWKSKWAYHRQEAHTHTATPNSSAPRPPTTGMRERWRRSKWYTAWVPGAPHFVAPPLA
jgi:hypothetical protein